MMVHISDTDNCNNITQQTVDNNIPKNCSLHHSILKKIKFFFSFKFDLLEQQEP